MAMQCTDHVKLLIVILLSGSGRDEASVLLSADKQLEIKNN